jgi:hypothetical protein
VLNFVHVADEPADLLRELAILFDRRDRFEIMRRIIHDQHCDGSATTAEVVTDLENSHPAHDLDLQHSLERLLQARVLQDGDVHQFRQWIKEGVKLPWDSLCAIIDPHAPGVNRWDFITVASELIRLERLNVSGLMPGVVATA